MRRPPRPLALRRPRRAQISAEQLASLSHEFRTPLNGVLGMAGLLEATKLTAEQRAYAVALRESGEHLLTLVNDVLDFAKLGAGRVELHPSDVDVEGLLRSVCELLSPRAREKGLEIAWAAPKDMGAIRADEGRLRQILLNFAGNAVKFTHDGGVLLSVVQPTPGRLRFIVEDTGPGVSEAQRERIFEAFAQADAAHADLGGAGLGLAIARRLATAMDGEVGVESPGTDGSSFWFEAAFRRLPVVEPARTLAGRIVGVASANRMVREAARRQIEACGGEAVVATELAALEAALKPGSVILLDNTLASGAKRLRRPEVHPTIVLLAPDERGRIAGFRRAGFAGYLIKPLRRASLSERVLIAAGGAQVLAEGYEDERVAAAAALGKRILLVEDNPINALLARALLSREGCSVDHAARGEEAIAAVKVGTYDLILMDMRMPGLDGEQTSRELRRLGVVTPIVALTANAFEDDRHACLAAGMNDFLVKPLSPAALRAMLIRWAGPRGQTTEGESAPAAKTSRG
ncbi:MAG: response regulator [Phenylobacterium sp.]